MTEKKVLKPVALAIGAALAGSFAIGSAANADPGASPFAMTSLSSGYMLTVGEGSCGGDKEGGMQDDKDAEASCGGDKKDGMDHDKDAEASCGGDKKDGMDHDKDAEASCGGDKKGEAKDKAEGSCGEGSCGSDKQG
ncbi:MAG TPA: hypothetical protein PKK10_10155 [Woeseiaceae bacterium]|nr:hypothetical protein [Woeseiaceae bacterium]